MPRINHDEADLAIGEPEPDMEYPPSYNDVMAEHGLEDD